MNIDGDPRAAAGLRPRSSSFNGAVDEHRRRPSSAIRGSAARIVASMEPSMNIDGDKQVPTTQLLDLQLQWSRR